MIYAKVLGGLAALVLAALAIRWCAQTVDKAGKYDDAVSQLAHEREQNSVNIRAIAHDIAESEQDRKGLQDRLASIDKRFDDIRIPPAETLIQPMKEVPGAPCRSFGLSDPFVGVYNDAATSVGPAKGKTD